MNPMDTFDPTARCLVHDKLNNELIMWRPEWAERYRKYAQPYDTPGVISWDGLLLDGWSTPR
jgi:hypothetical protein